jgi:hypothetical protein
MLLARKKSPAKVHIFNSFSDCNYLRRQKAEMGFSKDNAAEEKRRGITKCTFKRSDKLHGHGASIQKPAAKRKTLFVTFK